MQTIRTDRAREDFLSTLAASCNVSQACRSANISRAAAYEWRADDAGFAAAWSDAEGAAIDELEGVAYKRAMSGESDRMIEILLKGHRSKYRDKVKHVGGDDGDNPITFTGWEITFGTQEA